ncbi:hypothetical protein [Nocardia sp. alder85J]|uniref:hypothetical protein n=1 Tax=Nocardia sp. alder85J TaxID=2862949 RepID=UPI001CD2AF87|nr:hypothetical protein [Nocardia sp. alder85J]MCX4092079.1 hypothetical protein [Nocardia sp. alder85J]
MGGAYLENHAGDQEFELARALDKVGLVIELNLDENAIRDVQELFGRLAAETVPKHGLAPLIRKYPALTLITLVGHAVLAYEQGRYWESFWAEIELERDQKFENALRAALSTLLRKFRLREFPELAGEYVQVMTLHAGIPVHCLGDLIEVIEAHLVCGREPTGAAVYEWLIQPGREYRMNILDVPVRNFLRYGGEIAVDILDRTIDFLAHTVENPEVWNDFNLDTSTTGLPTVLLDELIERLRKQPLGQDSMVSDVSSRERKPVVTYSLGDDQITVGVPYPAVAPERPWRISFDGDTHEVYAEAGWGVTGTSDHPLTPVLVPRPTREVVLEHKGSGTKTQISVVDKSDPLLLFDNDGTLIPRHRALPRDVVIAVHPHDAELTDAITGLTITSQGDVRTPSGWRGWRAHTVELIGHDSIQLRRRGVSAGPPRGVRAVGSPRLEPADPLPGLTTGSGLPVFGERPEITLPPHSRSGSQQWHVHVCRSGSSAWETQGQWESAAEPTSVDPFEGLPAGQLGLFDIVVTGPLGAGLRCTLFLAEGLSIEYDAEFRRPVPGGLSPAVALISCPATLTVDRDLIELASEEPATHLHVTDASHTHHLTMRPPHFQSRIDTIGSAAQWRTTPAVVHAGDLAGHMTVAARVPGDVFVDFALLDATGQPHQIEVPSVPSDDVFQLPASKFADTARRLGVARLVVRADTADGHSHEITIAQIRPARLCGDVRIDGDQLVFDGLAEEDLAAFVWLTTAPWEPPVQLPITGPRTELPPSLRRAGPLLVQVFVDDPWATITPPRQPGDALRADQPGWFTDTDPAHAELSRYLAGVGAPPRNSSAMPALWSALSLLPVGRSDRGITYRRGALLRALAVNPRAALEALGDSTIPAEEMPALLIRAGLAETSYAADSTLNELHHNPWVGCLVEISDLPSLWARRDEVADERADTLGYLRIQGGEWLMNLLRGKLGDPREGAFDRTVERLHGMPRQRVDELFEAFQLVPGALLDLDTRTSGVIGAFHNRTAWTRDPARTVLEEYVHRALYSVRTVAPLVYDMIRARNEALDGVDVVGHPWMLLSVQSLTLAALARFDARGLFDTPPIAPDMRESWARMAELCPAMVAADLLIADALATVVTHSDLIGADQ